jgi:hypothetical protein
VATRIPLIAVKTKTLAAPLRHLLLGQAPLALAADRRDTHRRCWQG